MTLAEILALEPRLGALLERARRKRPASWQDFADLKREAERLVGPGREDDDHFELQSPEAWNAAVSALLEGCGL